MLSDASGAKQHLRACTIGGMSKKFDAAVSNLRDFAFQKLKELDQIFEGHQSWLSAAVEDVKREIIALDPAAKRQRSERGTLQSNDKNQKKVCVMKTLRKFSDTLRFLNCSC